MSKLKGLVLLLLSHSLYALTTLHVIFSTDDNPGGEGDSGDLRYAINAMNRDLNSTIDDWLSP